MKFHRGAKVRLSNNVTPDMLSTEGLPARYWSGTLTVTMCGRYREDGRRYRVNHDQHGGPNWWMPGSFLERVNNCMFGKEA